MVEFIKSSISGVMLVAGHRSMALFNELTFSTYARPGETLKLKAADFVEKNPKLAAHPYSVLVLAPVERVESSKTGVFDEVLILDDQRVPWMESVMKKHVQERFRDQGPEASMWSFNAKQYLQVWRDAVSVLGVGNLAKSPYQNRHGGASRDSLLKLRSVASIQRRGRWAVDSSARIYDKPGRLQQCVNKHSGRWLSFGEKVRRSFAELHQSGTCQLPATARPKFKEAFKERHS